MQVAGAMTARHNGAGRMAYKENNLVHRSEVAVEEECGLLARRHGRLEVDQKRKFYFSAETESRSKVT